MLMIETRRLSIEVSPSYYRVGRFAMFIERTPYRPTGRLWELHLPGSPYDVGEHSRVIYALGYQVTLDTNGSNDWGVV